MTVYIIETAVSKSMWSMQRIPILRLTEPLARLSIESSVKSPDQ